ncbi:MAG: LytTR family DNA-binding domain-containing protein [Flavobacteriales bacterium]|nr:LytTR family DNA-binding domain-containing protein [Flavobacteriales bacterium]
MINAVILTSEPLTRSILSNFFSSVADFNLIGTYESIAEMITATQGKDVDVVFADAAFVVQGNMLSIMNPYGDKKPLAVVMAKDATWALRCFELTGVVDYVVKPSTAERLFLSLSKVRMQLTLIEAYHAMENPRSMVSDYIFVKVNKKMIRLSLDEILYIESVKDYIKIVTEKKSYLVYNTLTNFTASLPEGKFMRIHRSYTASVSKIDAIEGNTVEIMNVRLPFTKKYMSENPFAGIK